jgi:hypothetical protein
MLCGLGCARCAAGHFASSASVARLLRMRASALFSGAPHCTLDNYAQNTENMMAGSCQHSEPKGKLPLKSSLLKYGRVTLFRKFEA